MPVDAVAHFSSMLMCLVFSDVAKRAQKRPVNFVAILWSSCAFLGFDFVSQMVYLHTYTRLDAIQFLSPPLRADLVPSKVDRLSLLLSVLLRNFTSRLVSLLSV